VAIPFGLHPTKKYGNIRLIERDCHTQPNSWVRNDSTILVLQTVICRSADVADLLDGLGGNVKDFQHKVQFKDGKPLQFCENVV
jgi:hypothetical protein